MVSSEFNFRVKASQYQLGENDKIFKVISNSILNCMYITHNTVEHYGHFVLLTVPGNFKLIKLVSEPTLPYSRIVAPPPKYQIQFVTSARSQERYLIQADLVVNFAPRFGELHHDSGRPRPLRC